MCWKGLCVCSNRMKKNICYLLQVGIVNETSFLSFMGHRQGINTFVLITHDPNCVQVRRMTSIIVLP